MEDFGWTHTAQYQGSSYFVGVGGESDMLPDRLNFGTWNIVVEGRRTLMQRLRGIGKLSATDPIISTITHIVTEAGFSDVAIEP
ncbi:MAG TPA: hypothetical protein VN828_06560 [Acidobacteriaceae bacterium]|nr:hypothetical protein [Acidobacteriaceae bacterium]